MTAGANPRNEQSRIELEGHNDDTQLPDEIGEMVQLQYLAVRCQSLEKVPSSIRNLGRLQTVDVRGTRVKDQDTAPRSRRWPQLPKSNQGAEARATGREPSFISSGEPPLVPVSHPGASIRD